MSTAPAPSALPELTTGLSRGSASGSAPARSPAVTVGLVVLVLLAAIYGGSPNFRRPASDRLHPLGGDLLQEWVGGWMIRHGEVDRLYDTNRFDQLQHDPQVIEFEWDRAAYLPAVYPPYYYWIVSPLSCVPFPLAIWVWAGVLVSALLLGWSLVLRAVALCQSTALGADDCSARDRGWQLWCWWGIVPVLLMRPVIDSLTSSQKGPLLLLILAAFLTLALRRKSLAAGVVAGLLVCKPQWLIVMVPWLMWRREWRTLLGMTLTTAGLVGVAWWLSPDACLKYVDFLTHSANYIRTSGYESHLPRSACWHGAWSLLWGSGTMTARVLTAVSAVATLVVMGWGCRKPTESNGRLILMREFSLVILATCLVNPHLFAYDLTVLLIPLVYSLFILADRPAQRLHRWWPLVGLWVVTGVAPDLARATHLEMTTIWLFVWLCWMAASPRRVSPLAEADGRGKSLIELAISGKTSQ